MEEGFIDGKVFLGKNAFVLFNFHNTINTEEGMAVREIARLLSVPENTVRSRLRHARSRFSRAWQRAAQSHEVHPRGHVVPIGITSVPPDQMPTESQISERYRSDTPTAHVMDFQGHVARSLGLE